MKRPRIALVGERDIAKKAHQGIEASLALFRRDIDSRLEYEWIRTSSITADSIQYVLRDVALTDQSNSRAFHFCRDVIPIASILYTLHEGRQVREEEIIDGRLLRALCELGVKALGLWF